jgi:hypothetical protein
MHGEVSRVGLNRDMSAQRTAQTAEASTVPEPHGKPGGGLFGIKGLMAPPYIEHVAGELMKQGRDESSAYHEAVGIVENWAAGHDGHGNRVHPDVQAAAAANIAKWKADIVKAHAGGGAARGWQQAWHQGSEASSRG